jgi:perosamine synthetase
VTVRDSLKARFQTLAAEYKACTDPAIVSGASERIYDLDGEIVGLLSPVTEINLADSKTLGTASEWHALEGDKGWVDQSLEDNSYLLFWILDVNLSRVGHIGIGVHESFDSLLIGDLAWSPAADMRLIERAMASLEVWIEVEFSLDAVSVEIINDAQRLLVEKLGYKSANASDERQIVSKKFQSTAKPEQILTAGPSISYLERSFGLQAVSFGWNSNHSTFISRFEREFADYVGSKFAMATSSCTGALHLSLLALGIGPGDEVIVPEVTWVATASAVRYVGATPVFADVDPGTWTLSIESVESLITPKTKAIIPVHLYGFAASMRDLMALAKHHGLFVVEDAAPAIGTLINGKAAGTFGQFGCFSFQGAKMLVTGEGGMLVTDDETLFARAKKLQDHGRKPGTFWIDELGYKYKMSNATAAIGLGQLIRSENQIFRKRRIRAWYEEELEGLAGLQFQMEAPGTRSIHWMTSIKLSTEMRINRDEMMEKLKGFGIDSRPVFPAISQYPFWGTSVTAKQLSKELGDSAINLPSGVLLSRESVAHIGQSIRNILESNGI